MANPSSRWRVRSRRAAWLPLESRTLYAAPPRRSGEATRSRAVPTLGRRQQMPPPRRGEVLPAAVVVADDEVAGDRPGVGGRDAQVEQLVGLAQVIAADHDGPLVGCDATDTEGARVEVVALRTTAHAGGVEVTDAL